MREYIARWSWPNKPAITWLKTTNSPKGGLDGIISNLQEERYNPYVSDQNFELIKPNDIPEELELNTRVKVNIKKDNEYFGNVAIVYKGITTDTSTGEHLRAQKYWVFFNMKEGVDRSFYERKSFIRKK